MATARFDSPELLALDPKALGIAFLIPASRGNQRVGAVEVVSVQGPITSSEEGLFDSYEGIKARVQQACMGDASTVVLKINSPGGAVHGMAQTARDIRAMCAASGKNLISYIDACGCSAGYGIATAASTIVASETSTVGSIGTILERQDVTEMLAREGVKVSYITSGSKKAFGNPETPESDQERMENQRQINSLAAMFFTLVEQHRGIPAAEVALMEAGTFIGQEAVNARLVDRLGTIESLLMQPAGSEASAATTSEASVTFAEICKALSEMAASEEESAKLAAAMLAALEPPKEDKPEDDSKDPNAEGDAPPADESEDDEDKDEPEASSSVQTAAALAQQVETLEAENKTLKGRLDADAKAKFFAEHPVSEKLMDILEPKPLAEIEAIVEAMKLKPEIKKGLGTVKATVGPKQGSPLAIQGEERARLDAAMGLRPSPQIEESTPYRQVFSRVKRG